MPKTHVRVLGGGNTFVTIGLAEEDKRVQFLAELNDQPGRVNGGPVAIQGIGDRYPVEIATGYSQGAGQLTLQVWQTWGKDGWVSAFMTTDSAGNMSDMAGIWEKFISESRSNNFENHQDNGYPVDLVEVLTAQRMNDSFIRVYKLERGADGSVARIKSYEGCVITDIQAGERIDNNAMDSKVTITMMYTYVTVTNTSNN